MEEKRQAFKAEFERVMALPNLSRLAAAPSSAAHHGGGGFEPGGGFDDDMEGFPGPARKYG